MTNTGGAWFVGAEGERGFGGVFWTDGVVVGVRFYCAKGVGGGRGKRGWRGVINSFYCCVFAEGGGREGMAEVVGATET